MKRIIIQYGGTGDLALKKLYPAYQNLMEKAVCIFRSCPWTAVYHPGGISLAFG